MLSYFYPPSVASKL